MDNWGKVGTVLIIIGILVNVAVVIFVSGAT